MPESLRLSLLKEILSEPSAPFRERQVIRRISRELEQAGVPYFSDPLGNLVIGATGKSEYLKLIRQRDPEPLRLFIAHMDHPGFHGSQWKSDAELAFTWLGGSPTQHIDGSSVWLADSEGYLGEGTISSHQLAPSGKAIQNGVIRVNTRALKRRGPEAQGVYGGLSFRQPVWEEGDLIYTKAADDLVGAFSIVSLALDFFGKAGKKTARKKPPFLGLLTRAEEVGYIGAIGHFELGWLDQAKRKTICVSLETSRALPGAEIGKGPVIRLGDKFTVFDPGCLRVFTELARETLPDSHQRRIMDGGTCEASAATVWGHSSMGISVPLGNYHNQSFEGGPDSRGPLGPAPEFVHRGDVQGLLQLGHLLMKRDARWAQPWKTGAREMRKNYRNYRALLRTGP